MRDGGPAFPIWTEDMPVEGSPGMTLRDYFAGQALLAVGANALEEAPDYEGVGPTTTIAMMCYALADAMLEARGQT